MSELKKFEHFLRYQRFRAELTIRNYLGDLKRFQSFLNNEKGLFKKNLLNVTEENINNFLIFLKNNCCKDTIIDYISSLRGFYIWAAYIYKKNNLLNVNYFLKNIVHIKRERKIPFIPKVDDIITLRNTLKIYKELQVSNSKSFTYKKTLMAYTIFELFITSGIRSKELRGLKKEDIDLENRILFIKYGKGEHQRICLFGETVVKLLKEYFDLNKFQNDDFIFPFKQGNSLHYMIKRWAKRANINPNIHIHSFRHYFITESQKQGLRTEEVANLVGHFNLNSTRHYTHFNIDFIREKYKQIKI